MGVRRGARPSTGRPLVAVLRATVLAATILLATVVAGPAYAATGPQELRLSAPLLSPDRVLTVLATVPATLSGAALPEGSFTASQDGRPVPVTATRVADGPVELVLVLDVSGATLGAEQAAAVDLLRAVPSQTPTTVLPGGDRTTARSALERVSGLTAAPGGRLLDGLPEEPLVRRNVVVLAGCAAVNAEQRSVPGVRTQVSVLSLGPGCEVSAPRLAGLTPGVVRSGLSAGGLVGAADEVAQNLLGQYEVRTGGPVDASPVEVAVRAGTGVLVAAIAVPSAVAAPGPVGGAGDDPSAGLLVAASALAALAAVALALELSARRRSRAVTGLT
ncbi:MAG TPA: hypothetical protein VFR07_09830 [Mycobacteriales bacterium]|nr:hypothetical protein [Mycobacteriales bacterium]